LFSQGDRNLQCFKLGMFCSLYFMPYPLTVLGFGL
jgi:hypothetical protein